MLVVPFSIHRPDLASAPMPLDAVIVFALVVVAVILFVSERVSFDVAALIILSTLLLTGLVSPREGLAGFSNPATVTIGAMFVLSEGLRRTGALNDVSDLFSEYGQGAAIMLVAVVFIGAVMWLNVKKGRLADGVDEA